MTKKNNVKRKNIMKRNIEFIKKVEQKVKNKSLEKNKKSKNFSEESKDKCPTSIKAEKNEINKKKNLNSRNKKLINNITKNNTNPNQSDYIKIDVIQEEEEMREDSKHEKKD